MSNHRKKSAKMVSAANGAPSSLDERASSANGEHLSIDEQIRLRAYELYMERGAQPNDDLGDWLRAERELRAVVAAEPSDAAAS